MYNDGDFDACFTICQTTVKALTKSLGGCAAAKQALRAGLREADAPWNQGNSERVAVDRTVIRGRRGPPRPQDLGLIAPALLTPKEYSSRLEPLNAAAIAWC